MLREYNQISMKKVLETIDNVVVENLMSPMFSGKKQDGTIMNLSEVAAFNSLVAMHNEGVREMALMLKNRLLQEDDPDDA